MSKFKEDQFVWIHITDMSGTTILGFGKIICVHYTEVSVDTQLIRMSLNGAYQTSKPPKISYDVQLLAIKGHDRLMYRVEESQLQEFQAHHLCGYYKPPKFEIGQRVSVWDNNRKDIIGSGEIYSVHSDTSCCAHYYMVKTSKTTQIKTVEDCLTQYVQPAIVEAPALIPKFKINDKVHFHVIVPGEAEYVIFGDISKITYSSDNGLSYEMMSREGRHGPLPESRISKRVSISEIKSKYKLGQLVMFWYTNTKKAQVLRTGMIRDISTYSPIPRNPKLGVDVIYEIQVLECDKHGMRRTNEFLIVSESNIPNEVSGNDLRIDF